MINKYALPQWEQYKVVIGIIILTCQHQLRTQNQPHDRPVDVVYSPRTTSPMYSLVINRCAIRYTSRRRQSSNIHVTSLRLARLIEQLLSLPPGSGLQSTRESLSRPFGSMRQTLFLCFIVVGLPLVVSQLVPKPALCVVDFANSYVANEPQGPCNKSGNLSFCSMVKYETYGTDAEQKSRDSCAKLAYEGMIEKLSTYDCSRPYGYHGCSACREAYKYWICGQMFPLCDSKNAKLDKHDLCISICQDVVRKCPYVLNFKCPEGDTIEPAGYSVDYACNKLDRTVLVPGFPDEYPVDFARAP